GERVWRTARPPRTGRGRTADRADGSILAPLDSRPSARIWRTLERCGHPQCAGAQAPHLCSVGRDHGRGDDLVARRNRRRSQLGLSVLLDSRLEFSDRCAAPPRLPRRSAVAFLVVHAGDRTHRAEAPGALLSGRWPGRARTRADDAARLSWVAAGA